MSSRLAKLNLNVLYSGLKITCFILAPHQAMPLCILPVAIPRVYLCGKVSYRSESSDRDTRCTLLRIRLSSWTSHPNLITILRTVFDEASQKQSPGRALWPGPQIFTHGMVRIDSAHFTNSAVCPEIRLRIYSGLLICSESTIYMACYHLLLRPLFDMRKSIHTAYCTGTERIASRPVRAYTLQ